TTLRRSASIGAVKRTRGIGVPDAAAGLGPFDATRSAFRVAARVALDAPFLEHEGLATLWALRVQAFPEQLGGIAGFLLHLDVRLDRPAELVVRLHGRLNAGLLHPDVPLDRLRDCVGTGARPDQGGLGWHLDANRFGLVRFCDADVEDLVLARAVAVHRDAFAVEVKGEQVRLLHVLDGGLPREINRLRDGRVTPVLEGGLHTNVPFRRDVVRGGEDPLPFLGDLLQAPRRAVVVEDFLHEIVAPESLAFCDFFKVVEEIRQLLAVHNALVPDQAELGLAAAGRIRDHRERAGRRDRRDVRVAKPQALLLVSAALPRGIDAALLGELRALIISGFLDKLHDLAAPFDAFLRIVRDLEHEQHAREAHDPEADLSRGVGHLFDLLHWVRVHVDDVVQQADRRADRPFEFLPVDVPAARGVAPHMPREINRPQVARLVGQEWLFPALSNNKTVANHGMRSSFGEIEDLAVADEFGASQHVLEFCPIEPRISNLRELGLLIIEKTNFTPETFPRLAENEQLVQHTIGTIRSTLSRSRYILEQSVPRSAAPV